jgi:hypothetical protein
MSTVSKSLVVSLCAVSSLACGSFASAQCLPPPLKNATLTSEPAGVFVQWTGVPGCPTEGPNGDFEVDSADPPNVTLKTLRVGDFPVIEWRVGRKKLEPFPGFQLPRDLGSVKSNWNAEANPGIIVRIGTVGDYPVAILQGTGSPGVAVDIAAPVSVGGNDPWSSVELQTLGDVRGSVFARANMATPPLGGRIKGVIGHEPGPGRPSGPGR